MWGRSYWSTYWGAYWGPTAGVGVEPEPPPVVGPPPTEPPIIPRPAGTHGPSLTVVGVYKP